MSVDTKSEFVMPAAVDSPVQPAQRLVDVPEEAPLLAGEEERLLALHGVGALIGHVEGIGRKIAVGRLQGCIEGLVVCWPYSARSLPTD